MLIELSEKQYVKVVKKCGHKIAARATSSEKMKWKCFFTENNVTWVVWISDQHGNQQGKPVYRDLQHLGGPATDAEKTIKNNSVRRSFRVALSIAVSMVEDFAETATNVKFTCEGCMSVSICPFAWDLYNTDGDCLAMK